MTRQVSWSQQVARIDIPPAVGGEKPVLDMTALGLRIVTAQPDYDNGRFYILETVVGVEWTVLSWETMRPLRKTVDKYEAVRWADEFAEAENA